MSNNGKFPGSKPHHWNVKNLQDQVAQVGVRRFVACFHVELKKPVAQALQRTLDDGVRLSGIQFCNQHPSADGLCMTDFNSGKKALVIWGGSVDEVDSRLAGLIDLVAREYPQVRLLRSPRTQHALA